MDYSNLRKDVAARGAVCNDAPTKLIGGDCSDNRASTMRDLRRMISPSVAPTDDGVHHDFRHPFRQMRVVRFDRT